MTKQATEKTDHIAVDVAKASLQIKSEHNVLTLKNNKRGFAHLAKLARKEQNPLIVFEATGGYERPLFDYLSERQIPAAILHPFRLRAFARSEGIKAKNDPIDADIILRFAQEKQPKATRVPDAKQRELADLMDRRNQISDSLTREKNRRQKAAKMPRAVTASIKRSISSLEKEIAHIDRSIGNLVENNPTFRRAVKIMVQVAGVGEITAWSVLAYLGEISELNRNQLTALVGVAPFDDDSGKSRGVRFIQGGRKKVRSALYMAAHSAAQFNPVIAPYVAGLRARGKSYKCAIVAAMRKLIIHLQSLLKKHQISLAS